MATAVAAGILEKRSWKWRSRWSDRPLSGRRLRGHQFGKVVAATDDLTQPGKGISRLAVALIHQFLCCNILLRRKLPKKRQRFVPDQCDQVPLLIVKKLRLGGGARSRPIGGGTVFHWIRVESFPGGDDVTLAKIA